MSHWVTGTLNIDATVDEVGNAARECGLTVTGDHRRRAIDYHISVWEERGKVQFGADSDFVRDVRGYLEGKGVFAAVTKNKIMSMAPKGTKWKVEQDGDEVVMVGVASGGGTGFKKGGGWS